MHPLLSRFWHWIFEQVVWQAFIIHLARKEKEKLWVFVIIISMRKWKKKVVQLYFSMPTKEVTGNLFQRLFFVSNSRWFASFSFTLLWLGGKTRSTLSSASSSFCWKWWWLVHTSRDYHYNLGPSQLYSAKLSNAWLWLAMLSNTQQHSVILRNTQQCSVILSNSQ